MYTPSLKATAIIEIMTDFALSLSSVEVADEKAEVINHWKRQSEIHKDGAMMYITNSEICNSQFES